MVSGMLRGARLVSVAVALLSGAFACTGPRGAAVAAPVDLAIAPIGSLPAVGVTTNGERSGDAGRCSVELVALRIDKSSPGCFIDEHISRGTGVLHYPCSGDGPAEAEFGPQKYTGKMEHDELEVQLSTELDWEDGCRWGTDAVISGPIVRGPSGELTRRRLAWRYRDRVISGSGCSGVCTAKTSLEVASKDPAMKRSHDEPDEDDDDSD